MVAPPVTMEERQFVLDCIGRSADGIRLRTSASIALAYPHLLGQVDRLDLIFRTLEAERRIYAKPPVIPMTGWDGKIYHLGFRCPDCGMVSHNPNDAKHNYCGNCREFKQ